MDLGIEFLECETAETYKTVEFLQEFKRRGKREIVAQNEKKKNSSKDRHFFSPCKCKFA